MATYTTNAEVLKEAGMYNNSHIEPSLVTKYREEAYALIRAKVACRYNIALLVSTNTTFAGSDAERVLQRIEELYAAGMLLTKEYGHNDDPNDTDGVDKLTRADAMLTDIANGMLKLISDTGAEFPQDTSSLSSVDAYGFPSGPVATNDSGEEINRKFSISMKF